MNIKRLFTMRRSVKNTKNLLAIFLVFFVSLLGFGLLAYPVQAVSQLVPTMEETFTGTGLPMVSITVFILQILRIFFAVLGVIALSLLIYGGFIWMTSQGDPNKIDKAKQIIYNTVIGLIIIFSAFAIASFLINFLTGVTGGSGGGTNIPGGSGDLGRSAIGAGPVESVYPHPNQVNVPINTRIAVTFKQGIVANSICKDATAEGGNNNGICDNGEAIKNISICEIAATSTACLEGEFNEAAYATTTVSQVSSTDFKTFVFRTAKYLGAEDGKIRAFKVTLGKGITVISTSKSIFDGYRYDSYNWSFKTNGILDLTPPEIAKLQIIPNPDNESDVYTVDTAATVGSSTLDFSLQPTAYHPVLVYNNDTQKNVPLLDKALENVSLVRLTGEVAGNFKLQLNGTIGTDASGSKTYQIAIIAPEYAKLSPVDDWKNDLGVTLEKCPDGSISCLKISNRRQISTDAGFYFLATGDLPVGSNWSLNVTNKLAGSRLVFNDGSKEVQFAYVDANYYSYPAVVKERYLDGGIEKTRDLNIVNLGNSVSVTKQNTATALNKVLGAYIKAEVSGNSILITPINAGGNNFSLAADSFGGSSVTGQLKGADRAVGRTVKGMADPYNNSIFRISFTEAVSPLTLDDSIIITINGVVVAASTTVTNQYKTVELVGTHECGINSCGEKMYCWLDPNASLTSSSPATIEIRAARLRFCVDGNQEAIANAWCSRFGGTCSGYSSTATAPADQGRCKLSTGLFYPQAFWAADNVEKLRTLLSDAEGSALKQNWGIVDMAENSLNGNFDSAANAKGMAVGNAQGRSESGPGRSGLLAYNANSHLDATTAVFNYKPDSAVGDNFRWSFFISTQIDKSSPLLTRLEPIGDYALGNIVGESFGQPVKLFFNTLMRMDTLRGGWGYGKDKTDQAWNIRYLILKTISKNANPVGYWGNSSDVDFDGDGLADYTLTNLQHNPFDQSVSYGPLIGSGVESITQNCFLPGNGPQNAGAENATNTPDSLPKNYCRYTAAGGGTIGCVTDSAISSDSRVTTTNPSSYGYMKCADIDGAAECYKGNDNGKKCVVHWGASANASSGSWIITKDHPSVKTPSTGSTGCCFGKCF